MLDFLSSTGVGKVVPAVEAEKDAGSDASEWELRELREPEEERTAVELGAGEGTPLFLPTPLDGIGRRGVGAVASLLVFFSSEIPLVRTCSLL